MGEDRGRRRRGLDPEGGEPGERHEETGQPPTPSSEAATDVAGPGEQAPEPLAQTVAAAEQASEPPAQAEAPAAHAPASPETYAPATTSIPAATGAGIQFSYTGQRFVLGYGGDFYGIWDRLAPGGPIQRFPRTDDGWWSSPTRARR